MSLSSITKWFSSPKGLTAEREATMKRCLNLVLTLVMEEHRCACDQALSLDELSIALHEIVDDNTSRPKEFLCEFYKATWDLFGPNLF